jgi:hydrogenase nickel incorporation protein HypA/HybF
MHELSIALSIVDGVLEEAEHRGLSQVQAVHLRVGALSGVDKDALRFAYPMACEGTPLQGSSLEITDVDVLIYCAACVAERKPRALDDICCSDCGTPSGQIVRGAELEITGVEVSPSEVAS